jgi:hypothetical protein
MTLSASHLPAPVDTIDTNPAILRLRFTMALLNYHTAQAQLILAKDYGAESVILRRAEHNVNYWRGKVQSQCPHEDVVDNSHGSQFDPENVVEEHLCLVCGKVNP